ncbi:MAG: hypothetical protein WBQ95_08865, partial [Terracidiphilus sp.]
MIVTWVAWVATTVSAAVSPVVIAVGLAVMVIVGLLRILLPANSAHAEIRNQRTLNEETRK